MSISESDSDFMESIADVFVEVPGLKQLLALCQASADGVSMSRIANFPDLVEAVSVCIDAGIGTIDGRGDYIGDGFVEREALFTVHAELLRVLKDVGFEF